ncbi:hypothetical protein Tco_0486159, partial [Tanacetum coccineum]
MNLNNGNTALLELLYFTIHNFNWFVYKVQFVIELNLFKWNNQIFIRQTLLEIRNMDGVVDSMELN